MNSPAPFGRKGCVTPTAFARLDDETLQAEAVLLAFETGLCTAEVAAATGLEPAEVEQFRAMKLRQYVRQGEAI